MLKLLKTTLDNFLNDRAQTMAAALARVATREAERLRGRRGPAPGQTVGEMFDELAACESIIGALDGPLGNAFDAPVGQPGPGATTFKVEG